MDTEDIIDLLTIVSVGDKRTIGEADVILWQRVLTGLTKDDCLDAIEAHRRDQPGVFLEPGHVVKRVKALVTDRYDRADDEQRAQLNQEWDRGPQDKYGYPDKGLADGEYPSEWTADERLAAYWASIERLRDQRALKSVASCEQRAGAMSHIRSVLAGVRA